MKKLKALGVLLTLVCFGVAFQNATPTTSAENLLIETKGGVALIRIVEWLNHAPKGYNLAIDRLAYRDPLGNARTLQIPNGFRKKITIVSDVAKNIPSTEYRTELVSSKVCEFGSLLSTIINSESKRIKALQGQLSFPAVETLKQSADVLISRLQHHGAGPRHGGIYLSPLEFSVTTRTTANCGIMLIEAYNIVSRSLQTGTSNDRSLDLARRDSYQQAILDIEGFLARMENPSLEPSWSSFRFVTVDGHRKPSINMWMDEVGEDNKLTPFSSLWTSSALSFGSHLYQLRHGKKENIEKLKPNIMKYMIGAKQYSELYMPRFEVSAVQARYIAKSGFMASCTRADNTWARRSDLPNPDMTDKELLKQYKAGCVIPPGEAVSSIGSDMPEYLIVALEEVWPAKAAELFKMYHNAPSIQKVPRSVPGIYKLAQNPLDPAIGWGFEFSVGRLSHGEFANVPRNADGTHDYQAEKLFHKHDAYDFDPITAKTKERLYPFDVRRGMASILRQGPVEPEFRDPIVKEYSRYLYAMLEADLTPKKASARKLVNEQKVLEFIKAQEPGWNSDCSAHFFTMASSTSVHNAALILYALERLERNSIRQ